MKTLRAPALLIAAVILLLTMTHQPGVPLQAAPLQALTATGEPPTPTPTRTPTATAAAPRATALPSAADPAITYSISNPQPQIGDELVLTLRITNLGNRTAQGVIAEQALPPYLALVALAIDRGRVVSEGSMVGCWVGDVAPGEVITCTVTLRVVAEPTTEFSWNGAQLTSTESTDQLDNNVTAPIVVLATAVPLPTAAPLPTIGDAAVIPQLLPNTSTSAVPLLPETSTGSPVLPTAFMVLLLVIFGLRLRRELDHRR